MAFPLSARSRKVLGELTPPLAKIVQRALETVNISLLDGLRTPQEAASNVAKGVSWTTRSKHLPGPDGLARAVDVMPWPRVVDGKPVDAATWATDPAILKRWHVVRDAMMAAAKAEGKALRWGGDWDGDGRSDDERRGDAFHFELT